MSDLITLKHLLNNKNLGIPNLFYCSDYKNLKYNDEKINNIINTNIIDDNNFNLLLEQSLNKKIKTKKKINKKKAKKTKKNI
tara:strand:- start:178 stop:423 length:246 start_codon:yes stop_codon:yes gene_type:complete